MESIAQAMRSIGTVCLNCLTFGTGGLYLLYGILILLTGLAMPKGILAPEKETSPGAVPPLKIGDIGLFRLPDMKQGSVVSNIYATIINFFRPITFLGLSAALLRVITYVLGIKENRFDYWAVFKKFLIFYFLIIPLPAAFLPPVGYSQAPPDAHLILAVVLLIFLNAIGDVFSTRITIRNFRKIIEFCQGIRPAGPEKALQQGVLFEFRLYATALFDMVAALLILCIVLVFSSVLFGVQIGAYKFSIDSITISMMLDRGIRFPELMTELYWFRSDPDAPITGYGIPGMFIFAASTFVPTILMLVSSVIWSLTLPLRILLQLPKSRIYRIITAEGSVLLICVFISGLFNFTLPSAYNFLRTIWAI